MFNIVHTAPENWDKRYGEILDDGYVLVEEDCDCRVWVKAIVPDYIIEIKECKGGQNTKQDKTIVIDPPWSCKESESGQNVE